MKRLPIRSSLLLVAWVFLDAGVAWAHKPIFADGAATDAANAVPVNDVDVSMVTYHAATQHSPRVWIAFEGQRGKEIELQLGVPRIERLKGVRPAAAVIGPGLPQWKGEFDAPAGLGGVAFGTAGGPEPTTFHEPFTGTNSWLFAKQKLVLPEAGRYYLVGYLPDRGEGKFWLAFGHKEAYGLGDWLRLPGWIAKVRRFHEVGGVPRWVWVIGALGVAVAVW
ncbi:MAG TPA: hypothetical protein PLE19_24075 [Planctomycetota bacterium]|nr:hypothetical protein [Planctomycetota bacterium]HRR83356.1 hypothetical protein [Planctomycetota bacterium]HRT97912.1 hypothetical protein [Planctomycetota bacterium]